MMIRELIARIIPSESHRYSLLAVGNEITVDVLEDNNLTNVGPIINTSSYESLNEQYPKLSLKKEPAFIVFNKDDLVLKTYDYEELINCLQNPEK